MHLLATTGPLVPAAAPAGERPLGSGYLLDTPIGRGATGVVWAGRRRRDNAPVAVKLLRGDLATDPDTVNRFLRERTVLVRLQHPNLVRVYDLVAEGDDLGIVMELVDGENLRARAGRVRLDLADAATVIAQVADALAEVHAAGLVHRDVKPENVLVTERDGGIVALLSDFGIARAVDGAAHTDLIATPTYVAPELITGDPPGPPVDVYALGVTAYELLAGRPPFSGPGLDALLQAHVHTPPTRPPGLADDVWDLVEACLRKEPAARPKIADVAFRWSRLAGTAGSRPLPELAPASTDTALSARRVPEPPAPEPPKRRRGLVAAAAVAVLGVAGGVAIAYSRDDPTPGPGPRAGQSSAVQSYHLMPATVRLTGPTAHLTWPDGTALPGLSGYVVLDERFRPVSETLPPTVTSYTAPLPGAGRRACFLVLAVGVSDPTSATPPPPACVTTPSPRS
ncbi:serine/threonine-protein kinase [Dactylosporangium sp. NBC_01737]|uniref:serine/threonine-protein kinase n=1 Tax=Dactylosporangium sp. NBC_01737 TaxID=2975959 RepID=UPI002E121EB4